MPLLSWRTVAPTGSPHCAGPQEPAAVPGVPVDSGTGKPIAYVPGQRPTRTTYARRDPVPSTNSVIRGMAGSVHERVNRIGQARDWLGRWQDKIQGRPQRPIRDLDEFTGESLAQWALTNVLYARKRPAPSFGFGLAPVLTHSVAARRQRRLRGALLLATLVYLGAPIHEGWQRLSPRCCCGSSSPGGPAGRFCAGVSTHSYRLSFWLRRYSPSGLSSNHISHC